MALIYQKTVSDKTLILAPREFIMRPFDFHNDWTEMRFGIFMTGVAASDPNTAAAAEIVTLSTAADRICFGIKDSASNDLPGFGSALFLGATTTTGQTSNSSSTEFTESGSSNLSATGMHETTVVGASAGQHLNNSIAFPSPAGSSTYNGFYCLRFVISNRGLSSQSVSISAASTASISGTDYSAQALRLLINGAAFSTASAIAWNDGAVARTIPDAIFIRMPFYSNRIRISAMRAIRYAP